MVRTSRGTSTSHARIKARTTPTLHQHPASKQPLRDHSHDQPSNPTPRHATPKRGGEIRPITFSTRSSKANQCLPLPLRLWRAHGGFHIACMSQKQFYDGETAAIVEGGGGLWSCSPAPSGPEWTFPGRLCESSSRPLCR